jgi:hypothetical protein
MKLILLCLLCPLTALTQDISGLWTGYVSTTEKTLPYEVVISKKNGEWVGYSQISFVVNGKDITSVKKLKVEYDQRHIVLVDEDLLKDNFDKDAAKKIVQTSELDLKQEGKNWMMEGSFKTKRTRVMRPAEGIIVLYKSPEPAFANARLQTSLTELQVKDALVVFKPGNSSEPIDVAIQVPDNLPVSAEEVAAQEAAKASVAKVENKPAPATLSKPPVATATKPVAATAKPTLPATQPAVVVAKSPTPVSATPAAPPVAKTPPPPLPDLPAVNLAGRKIELIESIPVYADSLVLSIYDNGEIDGDTVSVVLNGKTIMSKQRLGSRAQRFTVYLTPELGDELQLVMYAENLGIYPPNTGLLIIQDGNRRREVRFSGDLNKNAAISLKRQR